MVTPQSDLAPTPPEMRPDPPPPDAPPQSTVATRTVRRAWIGAVLVAVGVLMLVGTLTRSEVVGLLVLPALGLLFLGWGVAARHPGPLIPGAILTGLGIGTFTAQVFLPGVPDTTRGGVVVLGLAVGFLAIVPLTRVFASHAQYWPLIPGGILLLVGICLVIGGAVLHVLDVVGIYIWPVALIVGGGYLLWRAYFRQEHSH